MANKTWAGSNGAAWLTASGGVWSPVGDPGVGDKVIISAFASNKPAGPVGATTVHDLEILSGSGSAVWSNLTVSNTITLTATVASQIQVTIAAQTVAAQAVALTRATLTANTIAGDVTMDASASVVNATISGSVDASAATAASFANVTINGSLTLGGGDAISPGRSNIIGFGGSASIHFVGSIPGSIFSGTFGGVLTAVGDLMVIAIDDNIDLTGATITVGGNLVVLAGFFQGLTATLPNGTITGPTLATKFAVTSGSSGSPTIAGFGPAYKIGTGSLQVGDFGGFVRVPDQSNVIEGTTYGPGDGLTGTGAVTGGQLRTRWRGV